MENVNVVLRRVSDEQVFILTINTETMFDSVMFYARTDSKEFVYKSCKYCIMYVGAKVLI